MAIGAVLSNWVMELTVLPLVGLVGRLFCSMAGGFNSLAETLGAPTFIGKVFAFASAGWCGGAQPIHQVRSEAEPARPLGRSVLFSVFHKSTAGSLNNYKKNYFSLSIKKGYRFTVLKAEKTVPFHRSRGYRFTVDNFAESAGLSALPALVKVPFHRE